MVLPEGYYSVRDFGAALDGTTDDTAAVQAAVDKAAAGGGGVVYLPPGKCLLAGSIEVKPGVTIQGAHDAPCGFNELVASVVLATGGKGNDDDLAPALFELRDSSMVRAITVYYPEQDIDAVAPYPWTFRMTESDTTVECVTLINSYKGFRVGPDWNCRHRIRSIHGCVLRYGFYVDGTVEIGRIENCQIHPHWWSNAGVGGNWQKAVAYTAEHLECFVMARTDWEYITNNFMFSAKIGYKFIRTEKGQFNGHLTGCGADGSQTALWFESLQRMGVLITGGEFVSLAGDDPCQVRVLESVKQGCIRFVNTAFWGLPNRVADLRGSAYVSFNDCYFTNWREGVDDSPLLQVHSGRVQVVNSTFDTHHPAVLLGPDVKHALIQGNCGCNGVQVDDQTGGHAILRDNEAPVTPDVVRKFSITGRPSPDEQES